MKNPSNRNHLPPQKNATLATLNKVVRRFQKQDSLTLSIDKHTLQDIEAIIGKMGNNENLVNLWLQRNRMPKIAKIISSFKYANLQLLNLGDNGLTTLEPLTHADMPKLEQLWLWKNKLTNVDCLRKLQAPNLNSLDISANLVTAWPKFNELVSRKLQEIDVSKNRLVTIDHLLKNVVMQKPKAFVIGIDGNRLIRILGKSKRDGERCRALAVTMNWEWQVYVEYSP